MEVNVKVIARKCRLCAVDTLNTSFDIFHTCGLQMKIRKYLQITIKSEDYLPKIVCETCFQILEGFDRLCGIASNSQKELLVMLNNAKSTTKKERKAGSKRKDKKDVSVKSASEPKKKRRKRKKPDPVEVKDGTQMHIIPPELNLGLPSSDFWANFKLGQIIRDTELIKLILKALKWTENDENMEKLRNTDLGVVLNNSDLLHNDDLMKLIKSYMGHDGNNNNNNVVGWMDNSNDVNSVTEMEVKVDPSLFLPEETEDMETDDSRTISVDLNEIIGFQEISAVERKEMLFLHTPFECTSCPERFVTHVQLQDHVLTHLIKRSQDAEALAAAAEEAKKTKKTRKKRTLDPTKPNLKEKENDPTKVCQYCQKQFKRRQDLKFHINQHTGERPFKCVSCPKAFASSGNCLTHKKRMHPELFKKKEN